MKKMTCKELGGSCDMVFEAETFEEMAMLSQAHGKEMFEKQDADHLVAMDKMTELMKNPAEMQKWMGEMMALFNSK
jgi:hypothetical protein